LRRSSPSRKSACDQERATSNQAGTEKDRVETIALVSDHARFLAYDVSTAMILCDSPSTPDAAKDG